MAVPRFNHELPAARRQGFFVWSVVIHVVGGMVLIGLGKWLPSAHIVQHTQEANLIYTPLEAPPPPPHIVPPAPAVLAQKLSVDKGEIQRAYFELEHTGLITKETGKDFLGHAKTTYRVA